MRSLSVSVVISAVDDSMPSCCKVSLVADSCSWAFVSRVLVLRMFGGGQEVEEFLVFVDLVPVVELVVLLLPVEFLLLPGAHDV